MNKPDLPKDFSSPATFGSGEDALKKHIKVFSENCAFVLKEEEEILIDQCLQPLREQGYNIIRKLLEEPKLYSIIYPYSVLTDFEVEYKKKVEDFLKDDILQDWKVFVLGEVKANRTKRKGVIKFYIKYGIIRVEGERVEGFVFYIDV